MSDVAEKEKPARMTDESIVAFAARADAVIHICPDGLIILTTVRDGKTLVTSGDKDLQKVINEHAKKVFA